MNNLSISFGNIVTVSGKPNAMKCMNKDLEKRRKNGEVLIQDVTPEFVNGASTGVIAKEAQKGNSVFVYITGEDIKNLKNYTSINGVISDMKEYINLTKTKMSEVTKRLFTN